MKLKNIQIYKTLTFYEKNAEKLYKKYENANLKIIQNYLLKLTKKNDYILELGFGSAREINFLLQNQRKNVYGIEGCNKFVKIAKRKFGNNRFFYSILPEIKLPLNRKFDFVYSIALWMHLPYELYEETLNNIDKILKRNGKIFFSFSLGKRKEKDRFFQEVDENLLFKYLKNYKKIDEFITQDALNRKLKWKSLIFKKV